MPFRWDHVRVKLKKEVAFNNVKRLNYFVILNVTNNLSSLSLLISQIVTLGMPTISPIERVGKYVGPKEWNSLISDPDTVSSQFLIVYQCSLILNMRLSCYVIS